MLGQYYYKTGVDDAPNILNPEVLQNDKDLKKYLINGSIYTNILDKPKSVDRNMIVHGRPKISPLDHYQVVPVSQFQTISGTVVIK